MNNLTNFCYIWYEYHATRHHPTFVFFNILQSIWRQCEVFRLRLESYPDPTVRGLVTILPELPNSYFIDSKWGRYERYRRVLNAKRVPRKHFITKPI
jgi:hypothetical protein